MDALALHGESLGSVSNKCVCPINSLIIEGWSVRNILKDHPPFIFVMQKQNPFC